MKPEKAMGIDLGTTNSVIGVMDIADRRLLMGTHGPLRDSSMPSVVALKPTDGGGHVTVVGHAARARRGLSPAPILSIKRKMGTGLRTTLGSAELLPEEISKIILTDLVSDLHRVVEEEGEPLETRRAVITVPAHFGNPPQEATTRAGQAAGLDVVELLHEPVAAAIHYCWTRAMIAEGADRRALDSREENFLVYDLGGGTFDASVIKKLPGRGGGFDFITAGFRGDSHLGGDDFDDQIRRDIMKRIFARKDLHFRSHSLTADTNILRAAKILSIAEGIKIALSDRESVEVVIDNVFEDDRGQPVQIKEKYTREQFEARVGFLVERSIEPCRQAIEEAGFKLSQLDRVVLVGGSSLIPLVKRRVEETFCRGGEHTREPEAARHDPTLSIGMGAALKAASHGRLWHPTGAGRVLFRGFGSTSKASTPVVFEVTSEGRAIGQGARLEAPEGRIIPGEALGASGRVLFEQVPLAPRRTTQFRLRVPDQSGQELAGIEFSLRQDPHFVEPVGLNTSANVLSFELGLEITDIVLRERVIVALAPRLTPLPSTSTHTFEFPGDTARLLLRLFADGELIKKVIISVPPGLARGASIHLRVEIDGAQRVRCEGLIPEAGTDPFRFEVESPELVLAPTEEEFRVLEARVQALLAQAQDMDPKLMAKATRLCVEVGNAFQNRDDARAIQRMGELKRIMRDIDPAESGLRPPPAEVEELIESCRELVKALARCATTLDMEDIEETIEANTECVRTAAGKVPPDRDSYIRCARNLQRAHDALRREYARCVGEEPWEKRARAMLQYAGECIDAIATPGLDEEEQGLLDKARKHRDEAERLLPEEPEAAFGEAREAVQCALLAARNISEKARKLEEASKGEEGKPPEGRAQ